jgi:tRNA threonylcarbamoyladenosine biosynthesis protein TsaE
MPILDPNTLEFISRSAEQTRRVGMRLGALLEQGDVVCLEGDLGSGKTTLVQGLASGWNSLDPVSSPTFVLVNVYRRQDGQRLAHLDAYRLSGPEEADALDVDALLENGPLVVEWADRIRAALPQDSLRVRMNHVAEEQRSMQFDAASKRYQKMIGFLREQMFGVL